MADKETIQQKKEHAKLLYTKDGVTTQKGLAARVGVSEKTIGKWIKDENWDKLKTSLIITKAEELGRLYEQLREMNDFIQLKEKGQRFANSKEADAMAKLTTAIRKMETEVSAAEAIETLKALINLVMPESLEEAKVITRWADVYIKTLLK